MKTKAKGISAALTSALFLGMAPVFGKQAILLGVPPLAVAALRTVFAALLLLLVVAVFARRYLYIYSAGLLGCLLAGWINGLGSLFYYSALGRIDAGVGQLLNSMYPLFLILWFSLDKQPPTRLTLIRVALAFPALVLLAQADGGAVDLIGVALMLVGSALYALHLPINQRVLYEMPAPTVTLYTLLAMSSIVIPAYFIFGGNLDLLVLTPSAVTGSTQATISQSSAWWPILGLTLVTFFSRLTLFLGVKVIGGMQTALLGLSELLITVISAHIWLGERFTNLQWIGAILLITSLALVSLDKPSPRKASTGGFLNWLRPPGLPTDKWRSPE